MKDKVLPLVVVLGIVVVGTIIAVRYEVNQTIVKRMIAQQDEILKILNSKTSLMDSDLSQKIDQLNSKVDTLAKVVQAGSKKQPSRQRAKQEDFSKAYEIPLGESVVEGKKDAPVMITGFLDLQCPFSKKFQPVINEVLKAYPKKVAYSVKHFPLQFHPQAVPAAEAVLAAGEQGKYYEMLNAVLENNRALNAEKFKELAKEIGINVDKFEKDLEKNKEKWEALIQQDMLLGKKIDVRGTPTFYINGKKTRARTVEALKQEVDNLLKNK